MAEMDMKENLVELIQGNTAGFVNPYAYEYSENAEQFADYLITNGIGFVTDNNVGSKWISVKDRLPEDMVDVLTCDAKGNIHIMWHHHEYQYPFNIGRNDIRYFPVTHWCYLPQTPKGE